MDEVGVLVLKLILAALLFGVMCFGAGELRGRKDMQREAIQNGAARWETTKDGGVQFVWVDRVDL